MAVNLKSCYLFLLDNIHQTFMPTECPVDETEDGAYHFLEKNLEKCMKNAAGRPAEFREDSEIRKLFLEYRNESISFIEFAHEIAIRRYEWKDRYEIFTTSDLFLCEVVVSDVEYVMALELTCKEGMVHRVKQGDKGVQNNLVVNSTIIPAASLKSANFFMINLDKLTLTVLEGMTSTVDDDTYLYADKILDCETKLSIKETTRIARMVTDEVINKQELDKLEIIPIFERVLKETVNTGNDIDLETVANEVFFPNMEAKKIYLSEVKRRGIDGPQSNPNRVKMPSKKTQKLKTDTGIEVIIPLDYYNNKDFIEVIETPDGRVAIQIKNIGNIESK